MLLHLTLSKSILGTGNDTLSSFTSCIANRPSLTVDWIFRRKILQSLVAWEKVLCHLQYACCFSSSSGGMTCDNLMFPLLSNSSNMRSHLETSNVKRTCSCRFLGIGLSDEQEHGFASDGHMNWANSFFSSSELDLQSTCMDRWVLWASFAFWSLNWLSCANN